MQQQDEQQQDEQQQDEQQQDEQQQDEQQQDKQQQDEQQQDEQQERFPSPPRRESVGLPPRPFLYTIDQIAALLGMTVNRVKKNYIHFDRVDPGAISPKRMLARDISSGQGEPTDAPDWRVTEAELITWAKRKGIYFYERSWARR